MSADRHEHLIADLVLHEAWRPLPAPERIEVTACESSADLAAQLARQKADEYSVPASVRLGNEWPEPFPAPNHDTTSAAWARWIARMEAADAQVPSCRPSRLERFYEALWPAIVTLIGLCGALVALRVIWP